MTNLTSEQVETLRAQLCDRPNVILNRIIGDVAAQNLRPDFQRMRMERMRLTKPSERKAILKEGFRAAKLVGELGKMISISANPVLKSAQIDVVISIVDELLQLDELSPSCWDQITR